MRDTVQIPLSVFCSFIRSVLNLMIYIGYLGSLHDEQVSDNDDHWSKIYNKESLGYPWLTFHESLLEWLSAIRKLKVWKEKPFYALIDFLFLVDDVQYTRLFADLVVNDRRELVLVLDS